MPRPEVQARPGRVEDITDALNRLTERGVWRKRVARLRGVYAWLVKKHTTHPFSLTALRQPSLPALLFSLSSLLFSLSSRSHHSVPPPT